jgi:hypothetical protein
MLTLPGFAETPAETRELPDVDLPLDLGTDEPSMANGRLTALLAWVAVLVGIAAIAWIGYNIYDARQDDERPRITRVAGENDQASPTPPASADSGPQPTAVSLIGQTVDGAHSLTDLSVRVVGTETSDAAPEGQIIRQSPNAGEPVRNNEIVVVVSGGSGPIRLDAMEVNGRPLDAVAGDLTQLGLNVITVDEGSPTVAEGNVIRIEESTAAAGSDVHVVVSKGNRVQIPLNLQSMPVDQAVTTLENLGLHVNEPLPVDRTRIEASIDMAQYKIVDGDVVGIQESDAGFGSWVDAGASVTPVYYDAKLDP